MITCLLTTNQTMIETKRAKHNCILTMVYLSLKIVKDLTVVNLCIRFI